MTIKTAIDMVDAFKPNEYTEAQKVAWLDELDKRVITEIISNHVLTTAETTFYDAFAGYDASAVGYDEDAVLLVPDPYSALYRWWLSAQIDLANGEIGKYNNFIALFESAKLDFSKYWTRTHMPVMAATYWSFTPCEEEE